MTRDLMVNITIVVRNCNLKISSMLCFRNIFSVATAKIHDKSFAGNCTASDFWKYNAEIKPND